MPLPLRNQHPNPVPGAAQVRAEMLKSQFINGRFDPYRTRLYENPQLTFEQCQVTARQLMAAAQLSLLSNPMSASFLGALYQQASTLFPFPGANPAAAPAFKAEPIVPANAIRPYYPAPDDLDRYGQYRTSRDFDSHDDQRDSRRDNRDRYADDHPYRYDDRDDLSDALRLALRRSLRPFDSRYISLRAPAV